MLSINSIISGTLRKPHIWCQIGTVRLDGAWQVHRYQQYCQTRRLTKHRLAGMSGKRLVRKPDCARYGRCPCYHGQYLLLHKKFEMQVPCMKFIRFWTRTTGGRCLGRLYRRSQRCERAPFEYTMCITHAFKGHFWQSSFWPFKRSPALSNLPNGFWRPFHTSIITRTTLANRH